MVTAKTVVRMLVGIVSKTGNLLLSTPLRGDGTSALDDIAIVLMASTKG